MIFKCIKRKETANHLQPILPGIMEENRFKFIPINIAQY